MPRPRAYRRFMADLSLPILDLRPTGCRTGGRRGVPRRPAPCDSRRRLLLPDRHGSLARARSAAPCARRGSSSPSPRPTSSRSRTSRARTSAATRASAASGPRGASIGASRSTSGRSAQPSRIAAAPDYARLIGPEPLAGRPARAAGRRVGVARPPLGRRTQAAAGVGRRARRARVVLRPALRRALDAHQDRPLSRQGRPDPAAGRRRSQGLRRAHAAVGRARQGRPAGASATASGSMRPRSRARSSSTSASCSSTRRRAISSRRITGSSHRSTRTTASRCRSSSTPRWTPGCRSSSCRRTSRPKPRGVTQDPANPIHALYGENALKSRLRAHPDVAAIHHADLVAARAASSA